MIQSTRFVERELRRYAMSNDGALICPTGRYRSFHDARRFLDICIEDAEGGRQPSTIDRTLLDWPAKCASCNYPFAQGDQWQILSSRLWEGISGGAKITAKLDDAPIGAMWNSEWLSEYKSYTGPDGMSLTVKLPGNHDWVIDGRARKCTKPDDTEHKCWIRHGTPPLITVDKSGLTCAAGAGSIQTANWHGFLRNGQLIEA